jgi:hypothetical protein
MTQNMLFCFPNISAEIQLLVLDNVFCVEHHILADFCQMLFPSKASKIICTKPALFDTKNVIEIAT